LGRHQSNSPVLSVVRCKETTWQVLKDNHEVLLDTESREAAQRFAHN
jgi:hypothetical protein